MNNRSKTVLDNTASSVSTLMKNIYEENESKVKIKDMKKLCGNDWHETHTSMNFHTKGTE